MEKSNQGPVDIEVNTLAAPENIGRIAPTMPYQPVSFRKVEEDTILINPDIESMESRG
jgi:hypothetical protein